MSRWIRWHAPVHSEGDGVSLSRRKRKRTLRYYYPEHLAGYERIKAEGKTAWGEIHGGKGFDDFDSRGFLEAVLPRLTFSAPVPSALEYGCGTGPGACFLAERGFRVDAFDLAPTAIKMVRENASQRGLSIHFEVADACDLPEGVKQFDLIVDSYCLQCIVFDDERQQVFAAVQSSLKPGGYYLVSTAILDEEHKEMIGSDTIQVPETGVVYTQYGSGIIDLDTGIVLRPLNECEDDYPDAIRIAERWYLPNRRHLRPCALVAELAAAGLTVKYQDEQHAGSLACVSKN